MSRTRSDHPDANVKGSAAERGLRAITAFMAIPGIAMSIYAVTEHEWLAAAVFYLLAMISAILPWVRNLRLRASPSNGLEAVAQLREQ